jgi:hypothetical protein
MITHPEYEKLVTAVYSRESQFILKDPVFGTKKSLVVDLIWTEDGVLANKHEIPPFHRQVDNEKRRGFWLLDRDFVLSAKRPLEGRKTHDT